MERAETVDLNDLFERMTAPELEAYASDGVLPSWFETTIGARAPSSEGERNLGGIEAKSRVAVL